MFVIKSFDLFAHGSTNIYASSIIVRESFQYIYCCGKLTMKLGHRLIWEVAKCFSWIIFAYSSANSLVTEWSHFLCTEITLTVQEICLPIWFQDKESRKLIFFTRRQSFPFFFDRNFSFSIINLSSTWTDYNQLTFQFAIHILFACFPRESRAGNDGKDCNFSDSLDSYDAVASEFMQRDNKRKVWKIDYATIIMRVSPFLRQQISDAVFLELL